MTAAAVDPISLSKRYQLQLSQTYDSLRQKTITFEETAASAVNEYKSQLEAQKSNLVAVADAYKAELRDLDSPVPPNAAPFLLKSYLWTAVCMFGFTIARGIGAFLLFGIVGMVFDTWVAVVLTYVALPAFIYMYLRKVQTSEVEREQLVLYGSVIEGVLVGALFSNRYLTIFGPPVVLSPFSLGVVGHVVGNKQQILENRRVFLGALLGSALMSYLVFGFMLNFTFWYLVYTIILCAAAAVDLQLKLASIQRGNSSPQLEQWKTVVIMVIASAFAHLIASSSKQVAAELSRENVVTTK